MSYISLVGRKMSNTKFFRFRRVLHTHYKQEGSGMHLVLTHRHIQGYATLGYIYFVFQKCCRKELQEFRSLA